MTSNRQASLAAKVLKSQQADSMNLIHRTNIKVEGENQLHKVVMLTVAYVPHLQHIHT